MPPSAGLLGPPPSPKSERALLLAQKPVGIIVEGVAGLAPLPLRLLDSFLPPGEVRLLGPHVPAALRERRRVRSRRQRDQRQRVPPWRSHPSEVASFPGEERGGRLEDFHLGLQGGRLLPVRAVQGHTHELAASACASLGCLGREMVLKRKALGHRYCTVADGRSRTCLCSTTFYISRTFLLSLPAAALRDLLQLGSYQVVLSERGFHGPPFPQCHLLLGQGALCSGASLRAAFAGVAR